MAYGNGQTTTGNFSIGAYPAQGMEQLAVRQVGCVTAEVSTAHKVTSELEHLCGQLHERLTPVLGAPTAPSANSLPGAPMHPVPLAGELIGLNARLSGLASALNALLGRIEL